MRFQIVWCKWWFYVFLSLTRFGGRREWLSGCWQHRHRLVGYFPGNKFGISRKRLRLLFHIFTLASLCAAKIKIFIKNHYFSQKWKLGQKIVTDKKAAYIGMIMTKRKANTTNLYKYIYVIMVSKRAINFKLFLPNFYKK